MPYHKKLKNVVPGVSLQNSSISVSKNSLSASSFSVDKTLNAVIPSL